MKCICGANLNLTKDVLVTKYSGKKIKVLNFPSYECDSGHMKTARSDREALKSLLKKTSEKNEYVCDFNDV